MHTSEVAIECSLYLEGRRMLRTKGLLALAVGYVLFRTYVCGGFDDDDSDSDTQDNQKSSFLERMALDLYLYEQQHHIN